MRPEYLRVVAADYMHDCAVITFSDGVCAVYPVQLLYAVRNQVRQVVETPPTDEPSR